MVLDLDWVFNKLNYRTLRNTWSIVKEGLICCPCINVESGQKSWRRAEYVFGKTFGSKNVI